MAAFVEGQFRHIHGLTKTACDIWLKNEELPIRESLAELYYWFLKERGERERERERDRERGCVRRLEVIKITFL